MDFTFRSRVNFEIDFAKGEIKVLKGIHILAIPAHQESVWIWDVVLGDNAEASLK